MPDFSVDGLKNLATSNGFQSFMLALCVVLLIVVLAKEGMVGSPGMGELLHNHKTNDPFGQRTRFHGTTDHTGAGCGCAQAPAEQWSRYTDDGQGSEYFRALPMSAFWPPTTGLQHYQSDYGRYAEPDFADIDAGRAPHYQRMGLSEDALAEHKLGEGA